MTAIATNPTQSPAASPAARTITRSGPWKVAIVMPCFNRREDCEKLLNDLARQKLTNIQMWGVVVDNASTEPLSTMKVPDGLNVEFVRSEKNTGGSGGFNLGMTHVLSGQGLGAKFGAPDFVWWLDSDARVSRTALRELVRVLVRCPHVGAVGSALCDVGTGRMWECGGRIDKRHGAFYVAASGDVDRRFVVKAHYVAACSALVRREAIERTGLFPDNFIYYDDVDWCIQMTARTGLKVRGAPRSRAFHPPGDRRYALWTRYYNARNCFSHMQVMKLGPLARYRRAMLEVRRAVAQTMMGLDDLAELHLRGLRDAVAGKFDQVEPKHVLKPLGFKPHATLPDAVKEQLAKFGPGATLFVHPLLKSHIAGLEVFRRNLKLLKFSWPSDWKEWRSRGLGGHLLRDSLGAAWRALVSRTADVAIVPTGWPTSWFRGKVLIEITTEGYLIREPKTVPTLRKAVGVFLQGLGLAFKLGRRSPGIRACVTPPRKPALADVAIEVKP